MKHLNKIIIAIVLIIGLNAHAQDSKNPWAISFGANALDTKTSAGGGKDWFDGHFSKVFSVKDNWNTLPSISYVGITRYIGDNFSVGISGSLNKVSKFVTINPSTGDYEVSNPGNLMYYGVDATVKYSFQSIIKSKVIDPSISFGGGYSTFGESSYGTINTGAGITFWLSEKIGLELASKYKKSYGERVTDKVFDAPSYFQHTAGLVFKFGGE